MEYYYLDASNTPQGPHSAKELYRLLSEGQITPATKVAYKGATDWKCMSDIFGNSPSSAEPSQERSAGNCPGCGACLQVGDDLLLPEACPSCHLPLRAKGSDFISCVCSAFTQYAQFRGRATRAEFWWFCLFQLLVTQVSQFLISLAFVFHSQTSDCIELGSVIVISALPFVISLALFLPSLAVTVRRLHDTGRSGSWLLCLILAPLIAGPLFILSLSLVFSESSSEFNPLFILIAIVGAALLIGCLVLHLFLLVCLLQDSNRGPNKYGPSSKYPLG